MRKWLIGAGIAVAAIALVVGGVVYAASQTAGDQGAPRAYASMPFVGARRGGPWHGGSGVMAFGGELRALFFQALADGLSLTTDELEAKLADGQDLRTIALEQGVAEDELPAFSNEVRSKALQAAVADGVLTQEQADSMSDHPMLLRALGAARMAVRWAERGPRPSPGRWFLGQP